MPNEQPIPRKTDEITPENVFAIPTGDLPIFIHASASRNPVLGHLLTTMHHTDQPEKRVPWTEAMTRCVLVLADGMNALVAEFAEASMTQTAYQVDAMLRHSLGIKPAPEPNIDNGLRQRIILPGDDNER